MQTIKGGERRAWGGMGVGETNAEDGINPWCNVHMIYLRNEG